MRMIPTAADDFQYALQSEDKQREWGNGAEDHERVLETDEFSYVSIAETGLHDIYSVAVPRDQEWRGELRISNGGIISWQIPLSLLLLLGTEILESHWKVLVLPRRLFNGFIDRNVVVKDNFDIRISLTEMNCRFRVHVYTAVVHHIPRAWLVRCFSSAHEFSLTNVVLVYLSLQQLTGFIVHVSDPIRSVIVRRRNYEDEQFIGEYHWPEPVTTMYIPICPREDRSSETVTWRDDFMSLHLDNPITLTFDAAVYIGAVYEIGLSVMSKGMQFSRMIV